jgi:hypothetical protein
MFSLLIYQRNLEFWRDMTNIFLLPLDQIPLVQSEVKSPQKEQPKDDRARAKKRK